MLSILLDMLHFFCEIDCKADMRQIKRIGDMIYAFLTYSRRHDTEW